MITGRRRDVAANRCEVGEELWPRLAGQRNRGVAERVDRVDPVLGRLYDDRVIHAGLQIEPVVRLRLRRSRERHEQTLRDVRFREADLASHPAVDIDVEFRVARYLLQPDIGRSGDCRDPSRTPEWLPGVRRAADHEDDGGHWAD
jgi:hypothetical protein